MFEGEEQRVRMGDCAAFSGFKMERIHDDFGRVIRRAPNVGKVH